MNRRDLSWGLAFAVSGGLIGVLVLRESLMLYFYQFFMPETVYMACQGRVGHPGALEGALKEFLTYQSSRFECTDLPADVSQGRLGVFPQAHLYLALSVAWLWGMFSPSMVALWPLVAALYAAYVLGCFTLLRQFFPRPSALVGTTLLALSPSALSMLLYLRDFSKGPFILGGLVLLVAAGRASGLRRQLVLSALAGLVAGIGFGFRSDVAVLVMLAILFLGLGMDRSIGMRAATIATFLLMFALAAWPVLFTGKGGHLGAMAMQGATDPFNNYLGLRSAPYSWGARYSDELTLSAVAADLRPEKPGWDRNEAEPVDGLSQAITGSTAYLLQRFPMIGADLTTRALKSAAWIMAYPSLATPERMALDPARFAMPGNGVAAWLHGPYSLISRVWIIPLGLLGSAAFMLREYTLRPRQTLVLAVGFGVLLGYPALQFSMRHTFHLEFFWVISLLGLFHVAIGMPTYAPRLKRFFVGSTLTIACIGVVYLGLRAYQGQAVGRVIEELLAGPAEPIPGSLTVSDGKATIAVPVPPEHRDLVNSPADSMVGKALPISAQWDVRAAADRLLLTVGGPACPSDSLDIFLNYDKRHDWQPMDQVIKVDLSSDDQGFTEVLFPAFYRPTQHFASLSVPEKDRACIVGVERLLAPTRLPAVISAVLPPNWRELAMHLEF